MTPKSGAKGTRRKTPKTREKIQPAAENDLTIVAIGASAGGIEALSDLMSCLPVDTGIAFVLVQHLDPKHHSVLTEVLARKTAMTAKEVSDAGGAQSRLRHPAEHDDVHFQPDAASPPS